MLAELLLAMTVGREIAVSSPVLGPAVGLQERPILATNGHGSFAIWFDGRSDLVWQIRGSRVTDDGSLFDPDGLPIATCPPGSGGAFNILPLREGYLIVWYRNGSLVATRIGEEGQILTQPQVLIPKPKHQEYQDQYFPSERIPIASNGRTILIVGNGNAVAGGHEVAFVMTDLDLHPLKTVPWSALPARVPMHGVAVASDGEGYLLCGAIPYTAVASITAEGEVSWPHNFIYPLIGYPTLTWLGSAYLLTYGQLENYGQRQAGGLVLDAHGDRTGPPFVIPDPSGSQCGSPDPRLLATATDSVSDGQGGAVLIAACSMVRIFTIRINAGQSSVLLDTSGSNVGGGTPSIVRTRSGYLVAWQVQGTVHFEALTSAATERQPLSDVGSILSVSAQTQPEVSRDGSSAWLAWQEVSGLQTHVVARPPLTPGAAAAVIPMPTAGYADQYPALASDGTNHLLVWYEIVSPYDASLVRAALLGSNGLLLAGPLDLGSGYAYPSATEVAAPAVTWTGIAYVAAFTRSDGSLAVSSITRDGVVLDPGGVIVAPSTCHHNIFPVLRTTKAGTLLVWQGQVPVVSINLTLPTLRIQAMRLSATGIPLDPRPIVVAGQKQDCLLSGEDEAWYPDAVGTSLGFMIVWVTRSGLRGRQLSQNGVLVGSEPIVMTNNQDGFEDDVPRLLEGHGNSLLTWLRTSYPGPSGVIAMHLGGDGYPDNQQTKIAHDVSGIPLPLYTSDGHPAIVFSRISFAPPFAGVERLFYVILDEATGGRKRVAMP
jgi:hypothetical protein